MQQHVLRKTLCHQVQGMGHVGSPWYPCATCQRDSRRVPNPWQWGTGHQSRKPHVSSPQLTRNGPCHTRSDCWTFRSENQVPPNKSTGFLWPSAYRYIFHLQTDPKIPLANSRTLTLQSCNVWMMQFPHDADFWSQGCQLSLGLFDQGGIDHLPLAWLVEQ